MTNISSTVLSRDELLDWVGGSQLPPGNNAASRQAVRGELSAVTLVWEKGDLSFGKQPIVAVPRRELRDFFAFIRTYVSSYRPYTAFYRVIPLELLELLEQRQRPIDAMAARMARLTAGAVLAEQHLISRQRPTSSLHSNLLAAKSTLSAALGHAVANGYPYEAIEWVTDQWLSVHRANSANTPRQIVDTSVAIWGMLSAVAAGDLPRHRYGRQSNLSIPGFLLAASANGISNSILDELQAGLSVDIDFTKILSSSREDRVKSFTSFSHSMSKSDNRVFEDDFTAGLLLAIIGQGSFDMLKSAKELADRSPAAIMWFGICATLFDESNVLTAFNCLGRRIARDSAAHAELFSFPHADVNSVEYQYILEEDSTLSEIYSETGNSLRIELLPGVLTNVQTSSEGDVGFAFEGYKMLSEGLNEIRHVVDRIYRRQMHFSEPRQRELFEGDHRPRGRSRRD